MASYVLQPRPCRLSGTSLLTFVWLCLLAAIRGPSLAAGIESGEAQWIWSPEFREFAAPPGACFFRKAFRSENPENARVEIAADNRYELFVNGRPIGAGQDWRNLDVYDIRRFLVKGVNVVAVLAENEAEGPAGIVARVTVKQRGNTEVSHSTDATWRTSTQEFRNWQAIRFNDSAWSPARVLGELGEAEPWKNQNRSSAKLSGSRFTVAPQFRVERVALPEATGSLVAMAFNERGEIIASREKGPLLRIRDENGDGVPEAVSVYCDQVTNCQGILPLNGDVFAVGEGPEKAAFYRISDQNGDGSGENIVTLLKFRGGMGEHGPHAPMLGPDGLIYLMIGNHAGVEVPFEPTSPMRHYYDADLLEPKFEDAGGHAVGIKAPGGIVARTSIEGGFVELFAGGLRNAYDFTFNKYGDLFTFDSDMEWDEGLPWYRPVRVVHLTPGADFGWRSGWSNWPEYFIDSLPPMLNTGRGSPTGVECYNHYAFPVRYQNAIFLCDWSLGRILAVRVEPADGTYRARSEVFLQGRPLNVTDLAVGPDGWLYFSTGGRDTEGGIYRIVWTGKMPPRPNEVGIIQAVRQPQLYSAWGRNRIANIKREMGDAWAFELTSLVESPRYSVDDRVRGLDLMQLMGPSPSTTLLVKVSHDPEPAIRAKATDLMGIHVDEATNERLVELLADPDPTVRRKACESVVRAECYVAPAKLVPLLGEPHRFVAWGALMALERLPREDWQSMVLDAENSRVFLMGAVGLLRADPDRPTVDLVLDRAAQVMQGFLSDDDFMGLLRVLEVALARGHVSGDEVPTLRTKLAEEYPALEPRMNRELVRLLVYLQEPTLPPRLVEELERADNPIEEKLHVAMNSRFLKAGWSIDEKLSLLAFFEHARTLPGGHSFRGYLDNASRDFVGDLPADEQWIIATRGVTIPTAALTALAHLPEGLDRDKLLALVELDRQLKAVPGEAARLLGVGIVAVLARSRDAEAMAYLREIFEEQPERRQDAAMGLAQDPSGENWDLLVRALSVVEGPAAEEVLSQLAAVDRAPDKPEPLRQAILCGLRLGASGGKPAVTLLQKWTAQRVGGDDDPADVALAAWQNWFVETYPDQPVPQLPQEPEGNKWTFEELLQFINSEEGSRGVPERGAVVFEKAQCVKCHRFGSRGEGVGPDLSSVSRRFQKKELLESVIFPSQVISDQYVSKTIVMTDGRAFTGIVGPNGTDALVVLQANAEKQVIPNDQIEEIVPNNKSAMPEGLFNTLTQEEIADLFAYLGRLPQSN